MRLAVFVVASLLGLSAAHADFCEWNAQPVAQAALANLVPGTTIQNYCQSCGDKGATSEIVQKATMEKVPDSKDDLYIVNVNGHAIDLAYVFVASSKGPGWVGLGFMSKCSDDADLMKRLPDGVSIK